MHLPSARSHRLTILVALSLLSMMAGCGPDEGGRQAAESASSDASSAAPTPTNEVITGEDADRLWFLPTSEDSLGSGGEFHIYVDAETHPRARASFAKFDLGPDGMLPPHRHDKTEEISYFLAGEGLVVVFEDGERREVPVRAGHVWYVPPGAWHGLENTGDVPLQLVFATVPNEEQGLLSFFRRIGVAPGSTPQPLPPEEFARLAAEHDLILRQATEP